MTAVDLKYYYENLLINQYNGLPKASATIGALASIAIMPQVTVQTITFPVAPTSGAFTLVWDGNSSASINWNDSVGSVQTKLQAVSGLSAVTVAGSIAGLVLTVTFTGVPAPADYLVLGTNTLMASSALVVPVIAETDLTIPLAVQAGFNLTSLPTAVGAQLDIIGKYVGVSRTGNGFTNVITLDDADFLTLIQIAIISNNSGSSLATIQTLLNQFFPGGEILIFDYADMTIGYLISATIGSQNLVQLFVKEGLLPKPMGVHLVLFYVPVAKNVFGFRTYEATSPNSTGFNSYSDYHSDWTWLSYADAFLY